MKRKFLVMVFASLMLLTGCGNEVEEGKNNNGGNSNNPTTNEPTPENPTNITNEDMVKDQNVESLKVTQVSLVYDGILFLHCLHHLVRPRFR